MHGSLARAGKVRGQTPKVAKQEKKKNPKGRAMKRIKYNRRFVNVGELPAAQCSKNIGRKAHSHSQPGQATDRPTVHASTLTPRHSLAIALQSSLPTSQHFHTQDLCSAQQLVRLLVNCGFFGLQSCARQLALTECDVKPSVLLTAVVGFGKKRGPNSNPTS